MVKRKFIEICNILNNKNKKNKKNKKNIYLDISNLFTKLNIVESRIIVFPKLLI
jgi:hypothetical protein